jgi:hypothetical protein
MKKFYFLLLSVTFLSAFCLNASAQSCPEDVNVDNITRPTCGVGNGQFTIEMKGYGASATITSGTLDISVTGTSTAYDSVQTSTTINNLHLSGLFPDTYIITIKQHGTSVVCDSFSFILRADYVPAFTHVQSAASGCHNADGSILLGGGLAGTDSVSWISSSTPVFTRISTLSGGNTITGLTPGLYYVTVKGPGTIDCYTTDTVSVLNSGIACPAATFCATATDSTNLFPDGTFGTSTPSAGIPPSSSLPVGSTGYQFQPIGPYAPEDGFYAIVNNTFVGSYVPYDGSIGPWFTPFDGQWLPGWDHDHFVTAGNPVNGNMLVVNADVDPNIVIEDTINNLCVGKTYQFSAFIRSLNPSGGGNHAANETFLIDGVGLYNTGNIFGTTGITVTDWKQVGFTFVASGTQAVFSMRNNAPGGQGNDFAIDDIYVGSCAPTVAIDTIPSNMCQVPLANDTAIVTDQSHLFVDYQWQVDKQDGNGYVDVAGGAQTGTFGTPSANSYYAVTPFPNPILPDSGWTYRLLVATAPANLAFPACRFTSLDSSVIPTCDSFPLPVTFITVKAQLNNTIGNIIWKVGDQFNVSHYILQKSTDQSSGFTDVTSVTAIKGSSVLNYQADDYNLAEGTTYYRIKSVDIDGHIEYSQIVALSYGGGGSISVSNPVTDLLTIFVPPATTIKQAIISDAIGRLILEKDNLNGNTPSISVSTLTQGFYNLKVVSADGTITNLNFIKK